MINLGDYYYALFPVIFCVTLFFFLAFFEPYSIYSNWLNWWILQHYHPSRVLTIVYLPFALGFMAIMAYHEAKIDTRIRNIFGYSLFFISTFLLIVVSTFLNSFNLLCMFILFPFCVCLAFCWLNLASPSDSRSPNRLTWWVMEKEEWHLMLEFAFLLLSLELQMHMFKVEWLETFLLCFLNSFRFDTSFCFFVPYFKKNMFLVVLYLSS